MVAERCRTRLLRVRDPRAAALFQETSDWKAGTPENVIEKLPGGEHRMKEEMGEAETDRICSTHLLGRREREVRAESNFIGSTHPQIPPVLDRQAIGMIQRRLLNRHLQRIYRTDFIREFSEEYRFHREEKINHHLHQREMLSLNRTTARMEVETDTVEKVI